MTRATLFIPSVGGDAQELLQVVKGFKGVQLKGVLLGPANHDFSLGGVGEVGVEGLRAYETDGIGVRGGVVYLDVF